MAALLILTPPRPRAIVYIDGFNLYYGAIKDTTHKWLNLEDYCRRLLNGDDVVRINYFSALVGGAKQVRQLAFLGALSTLSTVTVRLGKFKSKLITCEHPKCTYVGDRTFARQEEKRTDVAIGVQMIEDAYRDACDKMVLISGDSDLVPAIEAVKRARPATRILVYTPSGSDVKARRAYELTQAAGAGRPLPSTLFSICHFPDEVVDQRNGRRYGKPAAW